MRRRLGYLHVPKVAGSSAIAAMRAAAPAGTRWCPHALDTTVFGAFDRFEELQPGPRGAVFAGAPAELADWDIVTGHFALPNLLAAFEPADVVVLMREPRSRVLSHYTFWRGWSDAQHDEWSPYDDSRVTARSTWEEFLTAPQLAAQIDNLTLRLLVGDRPEVPRDGFIAAADIPALVDLAIGELERLGHVDLIERGDACWSDLGVWVGLDLAVGRHNESAVAADVEWPDSITNGSAAALSDRTTGDRQLWRHVADRVGLPTPQAVADATWERHLVRTAAAGAAALRAELERWETSTTARITRPARALAARAAGRLGRRRS